ncbi:hypothetical protein G6F56_007389 [Rhizopus delemar]|nr:hypothetical protein G6F56_007389 [Rhizopus delemar]
MNAYKQLEVTDHNEKVKSKRPEPLWGILKNTNSQKIVGEHGAKLDSIIRHIQYIKQTTHGKCIVFSQFPKVIEMLKKGLQKNKINCITLSNNSKKADVTRFQTDRNLTVILLHSKSHSSGLTLVDAHTVFIVEPVLNESLEKQAINRVHRIGQTHETNVFYYIIQDTIEERIHSIYSTRQGNQPNLLTTENSGLSVLSEGSKEIVKDDDLRRCFTQNESLI